ncbi:MULTISPECIES: aminodeoxychorismate synthase component I [Gammaproteobacteria]|uniref:aminodeoxychorismate synthase component I n=1 Tax=Gammaproteobacteria TaxID=1236 RepID=UPI000DCF7217|nr:MULTISPECIES: aminodeoxychorismate synthase component I [Gammaproteobacteria]RTE87531.1 aminodeoxychorismate synthase component I [Aliidiomarina sp. B3213]TCZ92684.1 aminodeoxychorismate synthase component I [Lysobacter sp. N42]
MSSNTIKLIELPYAKWGKALEVFSRFANEPYAMLFDSANSNHPDSRFDILVRKPYQVIESRNGVTFVDGKSIAQAEFFETLESLVHPLSENLSLENESLESTSMENSDLPFLGGALGYIGYDMGRTIERLPTKAKHDINLPDACFGIYQRALVLDHKHQKVFAVSPKQSTRDSEIEFWQTPYQQESSDSFQLTSAWQSNMTQPEYEKQFEQIIEYLKAGDAYQINFAQRFQASFQGSSWSAYCHLRSHNKAPFSGYIQLNDGAVLSLSPERFVKVTDNKHVQTRPIKGTRPRGSSEKQDQAEAQALLASEKDRAENLMIADLLRNDMSRVCMPGTVHVPELFKLESFPAVHHLVSTVVGELNPNYSAFDLMRAMFPGGSITGAPKVRAMEIIEELEPHRRSVYCGSLAYFSRHGRADSSITIRTLCTTEGHIYCWAGGGIVIDSTAEIEYRETFDKVAKILPLMEQPH